MKRMKLRAGLLAALLILSLSACTTTPPTTDAATPPATPAADGTSPAANDNSDILVTAIMLSASSQVSTAQGNAIKAYAEAQGARCDLLYHELSVATQVGMIENAITNGTDVLIMQNQSEGDCTTEITKATEAGIAVILFCEDAPDAEYAHLYSEDPYALGYQIGSMAARWANEELLAKGEPVVAAVGNASVSAIGTKRNQGIVAALTELCPEATIADVYDMGYKEEGIAVGENILQAHPEVNLVVGVNDQSVCGVYETFVAAGLQDKNIGLFGIDGTAEAEYLISKDTIFKGVLDINSIRVSEEMVQCGIDIVNGSPDVPKDKVIYWSGEEVTFDNIENYKDKWGYLAE